MSGKELKTLSWQQRTLLRMTLRLSNWFKRYRKGLEESLQKLKVGLSKESEQTQEMLEIYKKQLKGEASREEIQEANQQFRDVLKGLGLGFLLVLPFSPLTLPLVIKLGEKIGIDVLPDSFKKEDPQ